MQAASAGMQTREAVYHSTGLIIDCNIAPNEMLLIIIFYSSARDFKGQRQLPLIFIRVLRQTNPISFAVSFSACTKNAAVESGVHKSQAYHKQQRQNYQQIADHNFPALILIPSNHPYLYMVYARGCHCYMSLETHPCHRSLDGLTIETNASRGNLIY